MQDKNIQKYLYETFAVLEGVVPPPQLQASDPVQQHAVIHPAGHHACEPLRTQNVPAHRKKKKKKELNVVRMINFVQ